MFQDCFRPKSVGSWWLSWEDLEGERAQGRGKDLGSGRCLFRRGRPAGWLWLPVPQWPWGGS